MSEPERVNRRQRAARPCEAMVRLINESSLAEAEFSKAIKNMVASGRPRDNFEQFEAAFHLLSRAHDEVIKARKNLDRHYRIHQCQIGIGAGA